jgi:carbonyl reductase 1
MQKIAIVTGSNQGLGLALVEGLCRKLGPEGTVYLTARDPARGEEARARLAAAGLRPLLHRLDVTSDESVEAFAGFLRAEHGGADIVISNAAARMAKGVPQAAQVRNFIDTNNHGTYRILRNLAPLLRDGGRLLVVASSFGALRNLDPVHHESFDVTRRSLLDIEQVMDRYAELVEQGRDLEERWPAWMNIPSKVAQVASTMILARDVRVEARRRGILIDAVCPGLVDTDASRPWFEDMSSAQSPEQAAADLIWLATLPPSAQEPYGQLVRHREVLPWL